MVKVEFLGPINRKPMKVKANSLKELSKILNRDDELRWWLRDCAVAVNDKIVKDIETK